MVEVSGWVESGEGGVGMWWTGEPRARHKRLQSPRHDDDGGPIRRMTTDLSPRRYTTKSIEYFHSSISDYEIQVSGT